MQLGSGNMFEMIYSPKRLNIRGEAIHDFANLQFYPNDVRVTGKDLSLDQAVSRLEEMRR